MSSQAPAQSNLAAFVGQIPPVGSLLAEVIATLALAAHAYMARDDGQEPDLPAAEAAIDVATAAFERGKERMRPEDRLSITQMLTETRLMFVKRRGL